MAAHTIIIDDKTVKTKSLIALIREMAKTDKHIIVDPEKIPNPTTRKAINDGRKGKVTRIKDVDSFFNGI